MKKNELFYFVTIKDLQRFFNIGYNTAYSLRSEVAKDYGVKNSRVMLSMVLEYLKIDVHLFIENNKND